MLSKLIIIVIKFIFLGINMFWALLSAHFSLRLRAKMSLSLAQNLFMPANINSIVFLLLLLLFVSCEFVLDSNSGENLQETVCVLQFILLFTIYSATRHYLNRNFSFQKIIELARWRLNRNAMKDSLLQIQKSNIR